MRKKRFVTLFPDFTEVHLYKDVHMIPWVMQNHYGFESRIASYDIKNVKCIETLGLEIDDLKKYAGDKRKSVVQYLKKRAREVDVLNMYHLSVTMSLYWARIYKHYNPNGKVYLKLDMDLNGLDITMNGSFLKKMIYKQGVKNIDLITGESQKICQGCSDVLGKKVEYLPNGCNCLYLHPLQNSPAQEKENIILTVGRLGSKQKNIEELLIAYTKGDFEGWKLYLVGKTDQEFDKLIYQYQKQLNGGKEIIVTGEIHDKEELHKIYRRAKIFVLPSKWESFGFVLVEALYFGCYLITTENVPSAPEIIINSQMGTIVNLKQESLRAGIEKAKDRAEFTKAILEERKEWIRTRFDWIKNCVVIDDNIK